MDRAAAERHRIEAEIADDAAYAEAQRGDTAAAYGAYLAAYPSGHHAAEARAHQQQRAETERLAQLPREVRNSLGMEFVLIAAGTFAMGSPVSEPGRHGDERLHTVTLSQPFYLGTIYQSHTREGCSILYRALLFGFRRRLWRRWWRGLWSRRWRGHYNAGNGRVFRWHIAAP